MKKVILTSLVCVAALGLAACTGNQKANTSSSSKTSSTTSQSSTSSSSSSSKENKQKQEETRKKYQEVLDRGALIMSEGAKGRDALVAFVDSQLPIGVNSTEKTAYENQMWKSSYSTSKGKLQYAFYDINKDGVEELLIGTPQEVNGLFSLHDDTPEFLLTGMFASAGGTQTKILILQDGTVIQSAIPGNDPEISATAYKISNGELQQQGQAGTYQEKTDQAAKDSLGLTSPAVDLTKLTWENFPEVSASASSSQEDTSSSTPSSDQAQPASTGMDINAIASGDFSSIAGTWQNAKGETLVFDKNGFASNDWSLSNMNILPVTEVYTDGAFLVASIKDNSGESIGSFIALPTGATGSPLINSRSNTSNDGIALVITQPGQMTTPAIEESAYYYKVK